MHNRGSSELPWSRGEHMARALYWPARYAPTVKQAPQRQLFQLLVSAPSGQRLECSFAFAKGLFHRSCYAAARAASKVNTLPKTPTSAAEARGPFGVP